MPDELITSADSSYAVRCKQLLALVKSLRAIGAQTDLDLPRIAVIGNQSAGKSSLVEAISGITVPRDAGTCTRCPFECRLSSSTGEWTCQVSIRWEYDEKGARANEVREVPFGTLITDKDHVELMLRRAQAAVLNPGYPPESFVNMTTEELRSAMKTGAAAQARRPLAFSRNVVCIDLAGPELTDLSFVDLPGIISNAEPQTVRYVEDLVRSHIKGNCLILIALPMSDDIDNQRAARLAREEDPQGLRTIGVLTKPDTLPPGATKARELWLDVVEGRYHPLTHGYYCTRQPDDEERFGGISNAEARAAETAFFSRTTPWSTSTHQHRFGTTNLVKNLSKLLTQVIDDTLPKLQNEVTAQLTKCESELQRLPERITMEPIAYVLGLVTSFCNQVQRYVDGGPESATLVQRNRATYLKFKRDIRSTAPPFVPYPTAAAAGVSAAAFLKLDEEDDVRDLSVPKARYMYLTDVRTFIREAVTRELPNNVPYPAKVTLIRQFQSAWEQQSATCFTAVDAEFERTVAELIKQKFERYDPLQSRIGFAIKELFQQRRSGTLSQLKTLLQLETTPFTQNGHYLAEKTAKALAHYKDARAGRVAPEKVQPSTAFSFPSTLPFSSNAFAPYIPPPRDTTPWPSSGTTNVAASRGDQPSATKPGLPVAQPATNGGKEAPSLASSPAPASNISQALPHDTPAQNGLAAMKPFSFGAPRNDSDHHPLGKSPSPENPSRNRSNKVEDVQEALAALAKLGYNVAETDLGKLNPPDEFEEELQVMAEVRAYFQVAYKRVIDYVPLTIDHLFLYEFAKDLQPFLLDKLGLGAQNASARCEAYLAEDQGIVAAREELLGKKKRLDGVQTELFNFGL